MTRREPRLQRLRLRRGRSAWPRGAIPARPVGLAITLAGLAVGSVTACRDASRDDLDGLADYIRASMADWDLPGLAVAVVHDGEVIFAEGFGVKELGRDDPVDAHTLFQIGSVSKSFGAAAIGALVDDGLVDWDDPVVGHVPWFRVKDAEATRRMTIRDLLAHTSGMPGDAWPVLAVMGGREVAERARLLDNFGVPGEGHSYSNHGYGVAGLVVEAVTGKGWGEWVRERLFDPLEMRDSRASPFEVWDGPFVAPTFLGTAPAGTPGIADAPGKNVAMPHGVDRDGERRVLSWQSYDNMQAAGSVVSSAAEMANWLRMQLAGGRLGGRAVLGEATVAEMHAPLVDAGTSFIFADSAAGTYGLGWSRTTFEGRVHISHGGGIFGFPAYAAMLPEIGAGVVVLANGSLWTPYYPHHEIAARVFAHLLGAEPRDWHGTVMERTGAILEQVERTLAAQDSARVDGTSPTRPIKEYVGRYADIHGAGHAVVEEAAGGRLRLHFGEPGTFSGDMEHWNHDVFRLYFDGGDGQAYGSSFATFTVEPVAGVTAVDLGFMGQYRRVR